MITRTHNAYHLGDNLVHLHFLRKVALDNPDRKFVHAAQWQYLKQLNDLVVDIPNLSLTDFNYLTPKDSIDAWRGANGLWYQHSERNDFVKFHVDHWFPHLAYMMDVRNPIRTGKDMLFDYPAIKTVGLLPELFKLPFDVLIINSQPSSGQFASFNNYDLSDIALNIKDKGLSVISTSTMTVNVPCTSHCNVSVSGIGYLSLHCHTILMVSTGPSWPTFNIWNQESVKNRIILLDSERVWLSPNTIHCQRIEEAAEILKESGLL